MYSTDSNPRCVCATPAGTCQGDDFLANNHFYAYRIHSAPAPAPPAPMPVLADMAYKEIGYGACKDKQYLPGPYPTGVSVRVYYALFVLLLTWSWVVRSAVVICCVIFCCGLLL